MTILYIGNTNFEWELETNSKFSLMQGFQIHPNFLQLQFLPLLYGNSNNDIAVTHMPPLTYLEELKRLGFSLPKIRLFDSDETHSYEKIESWGWSKNIKKWAEKREIDYSPPPFPIIKEHASKVFSFSHSPRLPGSQLLHSMKDIQDFLGEKPYPRVIKTAFGFSGRGSYIFDSPLLPPKVENELVKELENGHLLIGQPWVKRIFDFSTQWVIHESKKIDYLGATLLENTPSGGYLRTVIGDLRTLFGDYYPFLKEHLEKVKIVLDRMAHEGYYGSLGIDAMVYQNPHNENEILLHPIVEINLRKTMGWLALMLYQKHPDALSITLSYTGGEEPGLLPTELLISEKEKIRFRKQLKIDIVKL